PLPHADIDPLSLHDALPICDPESGVTDGLLTHAGSPELLPKIFYTNSEYEYWGRAASLIHTAIDGASDAPLMDNVRIYLLAAGQDRKSTRLNSSHEWISYAV